MANQDLVSIPSSQVEEGYGSVWEPRAWRYLVLALAFGFALDSVTLLFVEMSLHQLREELTLMAPRDPKPQQWPR